MKKFRLLIVVIFFLVSSFEPEIYAQVNDTTKSNVVYPKIRFFLPLNKSEKEYPSLEDEMASIITTIANQLYIDDIVVCVEVDPKEKSIQGAVKNSLISNLEKINQYNEAIVITQVTIDYEKILVEDKQSYFTQTNDIEKNQILTTLTFFAYFLDTKTRENLGSLEFELQKSAREREKSRSNVLKSFKKRIKTELKRYYWFSADLDSTTDNVLTISIGTKHGIKKGLIFELVEPERIWATNDEEWSSQPTVIGFVTVQDTTQKSSSLTLLRKWDNFYEGGWVVEHFNHIYALELICVPPIIDSYLNLGIHMHGAPLSDFDFGGGIHFLKLADSFRDDNYGLGFAGFALWRFLNQERVDFGVRLGITMDIPFKEDYLGSTVMTTLFSINLGIITEIPITKEIDFVINSGYRLGNKSDDWNYSEEDDSYPATWEDEAPKVNNSGFMLSIGFKYFIF